MNFKKVISSVAIATALAATLGLGAVGLTGCGGRKPEANAIVINNYEELKAFIEDYNSNMFNDTDIANDKYLFIAKDIDCHGEVLDPFLTLDQYGLAFKIDGAGHKISNFKITEVKEVGTTPGTNAAGIKVMGLFPKANGGELYDIEFSNFKFEGTFTEDDINSMFDKGMPWAASSSLHVGLVGYSKSTGAASDEENTDERASYYKDVRITNMSVDITVNGKANTNSEFPMAIGGLIGLDADTINEPTIMKADTKMTMRENITVRNLNVNVNMDGGAILVGGIAGQSNWERVTYKNCQVDGTVTINNSGNEDADYNVATQLGSTVNVGGIVGGTVKREYEIVVEGGKTDLGFVVNAKTVNAGNVVGLVITAKEFDQDADKKLTVLNFTKFNNGRCRLQQNSGESTPITVSHVAK